MSTVKLYYQDAYMAEFQAKVSEINQKEDTVDIILNQTAFFPEAGGQSCDTGHIGELSVFKVTIKNDIIIHTCNLSANCPSPGDTVKCRIDFQKRFSNMQQHTGEHIFSGFVKKHFNYENVGFHLSNNSVTMDYDGPLSPEDITLMENLSNKAIYENHEIIPYFPTEDELSTIDYRAKLELSEMGQVRLVEIKDIDICACCAPHVQSTGEVGILKVIETVSYKGGVRLSILCGERAVLDYQNKHNSLLALSREFSVPIYDVPKAVDKLRVEIEEKKLKLITLESQILETHIENAISACRESNYLLLFTNITDKILIRNKVNTLAENYDKTILVFNGEDSSYSFILASNSADIADIFLNMKSKLEIKGGGKAPMIQGTCSNDRQRITEVIKDIFNS